MLYEDISRAIDDVKSHFTVVCGDFNAKVGIKNDIKELATGLYGSGTRNDRGKDLIDFLTSNKLYLMNTFFFKKIHRRWTWKSPDGATRNEIDFMISDKKQIFTDITVLNRFSTGSDHRLLRAKIKLELKKERCKLLKPKSRSNWQPPENQDLFQSEIDAFLKEENLHESNIEQLNALLKNAIKTAEQKHCIKRSAKEGKISLGTKNLLRKRRDLQSNTNATELEIRKMNKTVFNEVRKDVRKYKTRQIENVIEENCNMKVLRSKLSSGKTEILKLENSSGQVLNDRNEILETTREFYKNLYSSVRDKQNLPNLFSCSNRVLNQGSEDLPEVTVDEVLNAIKEMKSNKAPGEDQISINSIKVGGDALLKVLVTLFNKCLEASSTPTTWNNAIMIILHKKGSKTNLNNYRPISLLSHVYKLFMKIVTNRLTSKFDFYQPVEQAGFRAGYGTNDHLQSIKTIIEKCIEYNKPLVLTFVDYEKAFDSVELEAILTSLNDSRIDYRYTRLIYHVYTNATAVVKLHETTSPFKINRGVRQGDTISPKLFTCVLESIFKNLPWDNNGISVNGAKLNHLRFADDIVLVSEDIEETKIMIQQLKEASERVGLKINTSKTNIMTNLVLSEQIMIGDSPIEQVYSYKYLGHEVSIGRDNQTREIMRRISLGWVAFGRLRHIFKNDIPIWLKRKAFETCVLPVMTYGAETLTLTKTSAVKLQRTQRSMERAMLGIRLKDRIPNVVIRARTKITDILHRILSMKWKWAGHLARFSDNRWTKSLLQWRPWEDKRSRGRPPTRWTDDIKRVRTNWMEAAQDRSNWKRLEEAYIQQWMSAAGRSK